MSYKAINIEDDSPVFAGANFDVNEFHPNASPAMSNQSGFPATFYLNEVTIKGVQAIRTYYNVPVRVNASGRTKKHNKAIGGSDGSKHLLGQYRGATADHVEACDVDFFNIPDEVNLLKDFHYQVLNDGPLVQELRNMGIKGFGLYDGFIHIDTRDGSETVWDERVSTKGDENFLEQYVSNIQKFIDTFIFPNEDGRKDFAMGLKKKPLQVIVPVVILIVAIYFLKQSLSD